MNESFGIKCESFFFRVLNLFLEPPGLRFFVTSPSGLEEELFWRGRLRESTLGKLIAEVLVSADLVFRYVLKVLVEI